MWDPQDGSRELWLRLKTDERPGTRELAECLGMDPKELRQIKATYSTLAIPKRNGGRRLLCVPSDKIMRVQKLILSRLLERLPCHPAATGFRKGVSIVENANQHVGASILLKMDIEEFFPRTRSGRIRRFFRWIGWGEVAADILTDLCTFQGGLPQGAATSPCLSNLVNYRMDCRLYGAAEKFEATYTRYADDITFSFKQDDHKNVFSVLCLNRRILRECGYQVNDSKTLILRRHRRQTVTGLVVNERVALPRETRRFLRAVEHRLASGKSVTLSPEQVQGWRGLAKMVASVRGE